MGGPSSIEFSEAQVAALYDLVEFRLVTAPEDPELLPDLEVDEIYALVGALVKLRAARDRNFEESTIMAMTSIDTWVGGALRRVSNAVAIAELHGDSSPELGPLTRENVEQAIQQALSYGFSVEAIADAAEMDVADVQRLANA